MLSSSVGPIRARQVIPADAAVEQCVAGKYLPSGVMYEDHMTGRVSGREAHFQFLVADFDDLSMFEIIIRVVDRVDFGVKPQPRLVRYVAQRGQVVPVQIEGCAGGEPNRDRPPSHDPNGRAC